MEYYERELLNCIQFLVRRIVEEELSKSDRIDIRDYESDITQIVQDFIESNMKIEVSF